MRYRELGKTGIKISSVGYGCMGLSHASGTPVEKEKAIRLIRRAYDFGYTLFDTAQCYNGVYPDGTLACNEMLVGEALHDIRDKVVIATKFGVQFTPDGLATDSSPATIRESVESSLRKLQTDYIDLYYQHRVDKGTPIEEVAGVMSDLIREGKIRSWGISMVDEETLRRANAVCPVSAIQNLYNMTSTGDEELFPVLKELGVTYVSCCPLSKGLLSGAYNASSTFEKEDFRSHMAQFTPEGYAKNQPLLDAIYGLAEEKNATNAQIALAYMMCKEIPIVPIPGSRKEERIRENAGAGDISLTKEELARLDHVLEQMEMRERR